MKYAILETNHLSASDLESLHSLVVFLLGGSEVQM